MKETERQFASHEEVYLKRGFSEQVLDFKPILRTGIIWISCKVGGHTRPTEPNKPYVYTSDPSKQMRIILWNIS
jgi:hypothetical protein